MAVAETDPAVGKKDFDIAPILLAEKEALPVHKSAGIARRARAVLDPVVGIPGGRGPALQPNDDTCRGPSYKFPIPSLSKLASA
ncbi:MAG: hypothetical protein HC850_00020 [Rhodomicrobium sp.]|nr:hypothetical protein [Rhodomicrobium sp.]